MLKLSKLARWKRVREIISGIHHNILVSTQTNKNHAPLSSVLIWGEYRVRKTDKVRIENQWKCFGEARRDHVI